LAAPPGYAVADVARTSRRGGGVAIIFRNKWKSAVIPRPACNTFEALAVRLSLGAVYFTILLVYRLGSEEVSSLFYDEFSTVLETFAVLAFSSVAPLTSKSSSSMIPAHAAAA